MTIQQIANTIDQKDWAFSLFQTKPTYKKLVKNAHKEAEKTGEKYEGETVDFIKKLIIENKCDEIQILPLRKTGSSYRLDAAPSINIKINNNSNNNEISNKMENNQQFTALAGLTGMGLNMSDIFTAKDKAQELIELKAKVEKLETENRTLENSNRDIGFDLKLAKDKSEKKNDFVELLKSPQGITLVSALASKFAPTPALGNPGVQEKVLDPKIQHLVNFLELESTPDVTKLFFNYIVEAHQVENAPEIIKELAQVLIKYNIIPQPTTQN